MGKKYCFLMLFVFVFMFSIALAGCNKEIPEELPLGNVNESPQEAADIAEEMAQLDSDALPIIENRSEVDGQMQSYLTGQWKSKTLVEKRPIAVMMPNNPQAMPQYGLSQASIIYEAPVEGRITRLMPIFEDYDDLVRIGPIRSSRDYYIYVAMGYQAIYCNWGLAVPYVEELINRDTVQNISAAVTGIHNASDEAFARVKRPGYATEFTGYLFMDGLEKAIKRHKYETKYGKDYVPQFTFVQDGYRATYTENKDSLKIYPGGKDKNSGGYGAYNPYFEYNKKDQLYYRFQDDKKQIDEYNNEQLAVSNVVLQYCHGEVRDSHDYLAFGVHGEGDALVFTNGKVIAATWKRYDGDATPAKFYDKDDKEIILNQGKTWICNIWDEYSEYVLYE